MKGEGYQEFKVITLV